MSRIITTLLLLLVFFFGGMSYGSFEKNRLAVQPVEEEFVIEQVSVTESPPLSSEIYTIDESEHKVHRTASFFEEIVTTGYEIVINILYQIANLFFD